VSIESSEGASFRHADKEGFIFIPSTNKGGAPSKGGGTRGQQEQEALSNFSYIQLTIKKKKKTKKEKEKERNKRLKNQGR